MAKIIIDCTVELVDSHHGIYAMRELALGYKLYTSDGKEMDMNKTACLFNPDKNPEWVDEELTDCYVKNEFDGQLWRCEWREGDIIAVNPNAHWDEENDCWELPYEDILKAENAVLVRTVKKLITEYDKLFREMAELMSEVYLVYAPYKNSSVVEDARKLVTESEVTNG